MRTQTIKTDNLGTRHLAHYDDMREWLATLAQRFADIDDGDNPLAVPGHEFISMAESIFQNAPDDEQRMMFGAVLDALVEAKREPCFIEGGKKTIGDFVAPILARAEKAEKESRRWRAAFDNEAMVCRRYHEVERCADCEDQPLCNISKALRGDE